MKRVEIRMPIWHNRSVGIDECKIGNETAVDITYKNKEGKRLYPHTFYITKDKVMGCPLQVVKGVRLRIVPISMLNRVNEPEKPIEPQLTIPLEQNTQMELSI